jgi:hypothetical protein
MLPAMEMNQETEKFDTHDILVGYIDIDNNSNNNIFTDGSVSNAREDAGRQLSLGHSGNSDGGSDISSDLYKSYSGESDTDDIVSFQPFYSAVGNDFDDELEARHQQGRHSTKYTHVIHVSKQNVTTNVQKIICQA